MTCDLFDMHCHLGFFANPVDAALALDAGGVGCLCATVTPTEFSQARASLHDMPNVRVGVGLHPWWVADGTCGPDGWHQAAELARDSRYVAEVGLDFARGRAETKARQVSALDAVLAACENGGHVLSMHAVRSAGAVLDLLEAHDTLGHNSVIFHWFSGSGDELTRAVRLGCLFSVGPRMLATRRGRAYARQIPTGRLLLETDLPASTGDGTRPRDLVRQLREALATLCEIKGGDISGILAATSTRLLDM